MSRYCNTCEATTVNQGGDPDEPQLEVVHEETCVLRRRETVAVEDGTPRWKPSTVLALMLVGVLLGAAYGHWLDTMRGYLL